ncbi:DUF1090 family protein [Aeromonas salmonicida]|uniref:DUF1090 family protein n=1 Tax=Aeromonas salmonicida TaxID=645 RepID=UPI0039A4C313
MLLSVSQAYDAQEIGCQARHQAVANQLSCANAYHNNDHIVILEQALCNIELHCTETGLLKNLQAKIYGKNERMDVLRLELRKAQQSEKTEKVAKNNFNEADLKLWILQDVARCVKNTH